MTDSKGDCQPPFLAAHIDCSTSRHRTERALRNASASTRGVRAMDFYGIDPLDRVSAEDFFEPDYGND